MRLSPGTGRKGWFSKDGQVWENGAVDGPWLPSDHPTVPLPETSTPQLHLPLGTLTHPSTGGGRPPHTRQGLPALAAPCYSQGHGGPRGRVTLRWPGQGQSQASQAGRGQRPVWRGWGTPGATALQRRRVPGVAPGRAEDDFPRSLRKLRASLTACHPLLQRPLTPASPLGDQDRRLGPSPPAVASAGPAPLRAFSELQNGERRPLAGGCRGLRLAHPQGVPPRPRRCTDPTWLEHRPQG